MVLPEQVNTFLSAARLLVWAEEGWMDEYGIHDKPDKEKEGASSGANATELGQRPAPKVQMAETAVQKADPPTVVSATQKLRQQRRQG